MHRPPNPAFNAIIDPIDRLTEVGNTLAAISLLGIFTLIACEIFLRNGVGYSLPFAWDVAAYLMAASFLLAGASALKSGSHVRVTAIGEMLSSSGARWLDVVACLVGLAICVALSIALTDMAFLSFQRGSTSSSVIRIPLVYPQVALAAGAIIMNLQMLAQLLRLLRGETLSTGPGLE
ncbi:TRAP transporter small permease [Rhizobium sp. RM]|uniref:TRAP transporter small permease subunit n=1 Tax=Rhizobium sp. RM TaxID=2748079 RepID=UPI00110D3015|nr:TRAP transporter small permease [Rhizobium sp. RM]NWJ27436.1 TRAP transporter small permease [Rhizobium sp. RM]TMV20485.1 TRAP transporter small permease [Rhizobium sp. Td3]